MVADQALGSTTPDVVAAARLLSPQIRAAREEAERNGHLPKALISLLAEAELYRLYLPRALGGLELSPVIVFAVIEELSKADGSVGWCLMNANGVSLGAGWLAPDVGRHMFGDPPDLRAAGSLRPQGRGQVVDGGYLVSGKWTFGSGVLNANWMYCPTVLMDGDVPRRTPAGTPAARAMWVPVTSVTVMDTWSVMGLRGTGSHDYTIDTVFVPEAHSVSVAEIAMNPSPLYRPRLFLMLIQVLFAANAIGIARGALDALIEMASRDATTMSTALLRDRPAVQARVGQAEAIINAARCYVVDALTRLWDFVCASEADPSRELAQVRLATPHAIHECVRAVDMLFHAAGTNAIYTSNPLERHFRDIHVATQHAAAFPIHYESGGKVLLGLRPTEPGW
jgi:indole-3-acetate monooxygenase